MIHLVGFRAFKNAATALANINAISEGKNLFFIDVFALMSENDIKSEYYY